MLFLAFWDPWENTGLCSGSCGIPGNLMQERSYDAIVQQNQNFSSSCDPG